MSKEIGTLEELNVKEGDVVRFEKSCLPSYVNYRGYTAVVRKDGGTDYFLERPNEGCFTAKNGHKWSIVSRAQPEYKMWKDMTDEEKGVLLLAHHEGKVIQWSYYLPWFTEHDSSDKGYEPVWSGEIYYRVKAEPVIKTIETRTGNPEGGSWASWSDDDDTHKITYDIVDGQPDINSIKMEKI